MPQISGKIKLPPGKKVAVNIGADFDAHSVWMGSMNKFSPSYLHRGEFGAEVGTPRLLKLLDKYNIKGNWCIPGHTIDTFFDICKEVVAHGHEITHHGYAHENPTEMTYEEEETIMIRGFEALSRIGVKPRGYRSPAWDYSPNTLSILEKFGFEYDSSLMGNDLHPYRPRPIVPHMDKASEYGAPSKILEIPVSWYLDDFPTQELVFGSMDGLSDPDVMFQRWQDVFDYAVDNEEGACVVLTTHPQTIGRAHMITRLEKLIKHMESRGAWFCTLGEIHDNFVEHSSLKESAEKVLI
jgi:peptidoglycan/xylan/chitin deacetylase (PgdA/CDA1 family)